MGNNKKISFGFRGWMVILYQAIGFYLYVVYNSFAQNIQATGNEMMYGWSAARVPTVYTITIIIGVIFQVIFARRIVNARNIKRISVLFMILSVICGFGMATIFLNEVLWLLLFALGIFFSNIGCTLVMGILIGQWFPRRKGTAMGIATLAFPITTGTLLSIFAANYFTKGPLMAYLPFLLVAIAGIIIGLVFVKDYPEQCGCYRDNDENMTFEMAQAMMKQEIEAKKTSVWTLKNTLKCRDFWFGTITLGILLATSVGAMAQLTNILNVYPEFYAKYGTIAMVLVTIIACLGSYLLGLVDTRFGTKTSIIISCIFAIVSGVLGLIPNQYSLVIGLLLLCVFMGSASNFVVSFSAQYWRREDFPSVYAVANPVSNIIQAFGPMMVAMIGFRIGFHQAFGVIGVLGVAALILICLFSPAHIRETDRKYRQAAGLSADDN